MVMITKEEAQIPEIIEKAEGFAKEIYKVELKQEIFEIKSKAMNDEHLDSLSSSYVTKIYIEYDDLKNIYKASNTNFKFLQTQTDRQLTERDRLEFIEMIILSTINTEKKTEKEYAFAKDVVEQLTNLEEIVFETRLLKLKIDYLRDHLNLSKKQKSNPTFTRTHIAYCIHYLSETKSLKIKSTFPSDKAWIEIGKRYNKNAKNIQIAYNEINSNPDLRMGKSKIKVIKTVVDNMLSNYPKALKLAKDELKSAQMRS